MKKEQLLTLLDAGLLEMVIAELLNQKQDVFLLSSRYQAHIKQFKFGYFSNVEFLEKIDQIKLVLKELVNQL